MVITTIPTKGDLYIDENLKKNLDNVKDSVYNKKWDYFVVIAGIPRVGKSTFAQQIASYLDPTFNIDRFCFTAREYIEKSSKLTKGQAIILDESFADLNTNLSRSPEFVALINHMQVIGQNNLFHILVLPDFFSLAKNVALFRASHLFVIYAVDYNRGRFAAFGRENKSKLYEDGKRYTNYQAVEPNFRGRFVSKWLVDEEEYNKRKKKHQMEQAKTPIKIHRWVKQRNKLIRYMINELKFTQTKVGEISGFSRQAIELVLNGKDEDTLEIMPEPHANII